MCVCVCVYVCMYVYTHTHQVLGGTHGGELGASFFSLHKAILEADITHAAIQIERRIPNIRILRRERSTFFYKFIEVIGDDRVQDRFADLAFFVLAFGVSQGNVDWVEAKCSVEASGYSLLQAVLARDRVGMLPKVVCSHTALATLAVIHQSFRQHLT